MNRVASAVNVYTGARFSHVSRYPAVESNWLQGNVKLIKAKVAGAAVKYLL